MLETTHIWYVGPASGVLKKPAEHVNQAGDLDLTYRAI